MWLAGKGSKAISTRARNSTHKKKGRKHASPFFFGGGGMGASTLGLDSLPKTRVFSRADVRLRPVFGNRSPWVDDTRSHVDTYGELAAALNWCVKRRKNGGVDGTPLLSIISYVDVSAVPHFLDSRPCLQLRRPSRSALRRATFLRLRRSRRRRTQVRRIACEHERRRQGRWPPRSTTCSGSYATVFLGYSRGSVCQKKIFKFLYPEGRRGNIDVETHYTVFFLSLSLSLKI